MSPHGQNVIGIDTHKYTHVAVLLNGLGKHEGCLQFPATDAGAAQLLAWCAELGAPAMAGVEERAATATSSPGLCSPPA